MHYDLSHETTVVTVTPLALCKKCVCDCGHILWWLYAVLSGSVHWLQCTGSLLTHWVDLNMVMSPMYSARVTGHCVEHAHACSEHNMHSTVEHNSILNLNKVSLRPLVSFDLKLNMSPVWFAQYTHNDSRTPQSYTIVTVVKCMPNASIATSQCSTDKIWAESYRQYWYDYNLNKTQSMALIMITKDPQPDVPCAATVLGQALPDNNSKPPCLLHVLLKAAPAATHTPLQK